MRVKCSKCGKDTEFEELSSEKRSSKVGDFELMIVKGKCLVCKKRNAYSFRMNKL